MRTNRIRRLRDGLVIVCASVDVAYDLCVRLNRIGVRVINGHYEHDRVTYVQEYGRPA